MGFHLHIIPQLVPKTLISKDILTIMYACVVRGEQVCARQGRGEGETRDKQVRA